MEETLKNINTLNSPPKKQRAKNNPEKTSKTRSNCKRKALAETNQLFETVLKNTSMKTAYLDTAFNFVWVNPAYAATGRHDPDFFPGKNHFALYPNAENHAIFQHVAETGEPYFASAKPFEYPDQPERGVTFWDWSLIPSRDSEGKVNGLVFTLTEVTERIRAENAVLRAKDEWERTFDAVPALITLMDTGHRVIRVNRAMAERLGTTPDKMIGLYCYEVIHGLSAPPDFCPHSKTIMSGKEEYAEIAEEHLGGIFDVITVPILDNTGNIVSTIHIAHDITARKKAEAEREKLEAQLNQSQKMESIGRLAGGVAHDYNNMLSVINGYSDILLQKIAPSDPLYECVQEIRKAGQRSADLTRQLLGFARKQAVAPKVIDINVNIEHTLKMLRRLLGEGVELEWKPSPTLWHVKIDPSQLDQILTNLLVNARDAISGAGKVVIGTDKVDFDESYRYIIPDFVPGKYVVLSVSDNGTGMDKETRDHMFEPFFTTKEAGKGSGLGLATVFGIVKQNQGLINVYSEPGMGTTFKIYLPWYEAEESGAGKSEADEILKGNETVLLVEDEESLLRFAKLQLEHIGYKVLTAGTPKQAIDLVGKHNGNIHLLMTDVVLPEMSGRALRDKIYSLHPGIKCLFISGYTAESMVQNGILEKGIHFLQKPFSVENLSAKLREVLS